jgi:hypothetical protein
VFDANSKGNPIVSTNITIASMTISGTTATINTNGYTVTISSSFTQSSGRVELSTSTLNIGGDYIATPSAVFVPQTSTVRFNGALSQAISSGATFYNLTIDNTHASPSDSNDVDPLGSVTVQSTATINDGQFQPADGSQFKHITINTNGILKPDYAATIKLTGDWDNTNGTFTSSTGTVEFNGSIAEVITPGGTGVTKEFFNLTINNSAGSPSDSVDVDPTAAITVTSTLTVNDGQFQPASSSNFKHVQINSAGILKPDIGMGIYVQGDWTDAGTFNSNFGLVTFNGAVAQNIVGQSTFTVLVITNSHPSPSDANDVNSDAITSGSLSVSQGQFQPGNGANVGNVTLLGYLKPASGARIYSNGWNVTSGTFTHNSGVVQFNNSGSMTLTSGGQTRGAFYDVDFTGTGAVTIGADDMKIDRHLTVTSGAGAVDNVTNSKNITVIGTATFSNSQIYLGTAVWTIGGSWYSLAVPTFNVGLSTIVFNGSSGQKAFGYRYNTIVSSNSSSSGLTFSSSFTAAALSINAATLSSAATIYFAGASTFTISTFTITGSASYPVVLKSTNSSVDWAP